MACAGAVFPDGVCFVSLAPISDPDLVPSTITQALELRGAAHEPLPERLKSYLQRKQMLLLLDNGVFVGGCTLGSDQPSRTRRRSPAAQVAHREAIPAKVQM